MRLKVRKRLDRRFDVPEVAGDLKMRLARFFVVVVAVIVSVVFAIRGEGVYIAGVRHRVLRLTDWGPLCEHREAVVETNRNEFVRGGAIPGALAEFAPEAGLVLGSGLGSFIDRVEVDGRVSYGEIEGLPVSGVVGHAGEYAWGSLGGVRVLVAQGRVHLYEGHEASAITAGVRLMAAAGIQRLVLTNAAGSANRDFAPGSWMMLSDHLNLTGRSPLTGGPNFVDMSEVYSRALREVFRAVAGESGVGLREGVYASLPGPQYETPAEVRMLVSLGADAVGMSTVLEAIEARALGLEVAGFSCLTNWGAGLSGETLDHSEVMETGQAAARQLVDLLEASLPRLQGGENRSRGNG